MRAQFPYCSFQTRNINREINLGTGGKSTDSLLIDAFGVVPVC